MDISAPDKQTAVPEFLLGGGEMGQLIREHDWSSTPLGPVESWPQNLRTCIRIMLTSRQPIWIGWGNDLIKLYNDPYKAIVGGKHPWALGKPASVVWKDIWKDIEPMLRQVMEKDEGTYVESQLLIMERNGYPEETYYTFSYTPIPGDDGKTAGMICANTDDTDRIISERQLRILSQLGQQLKDCKSKEEIIIKTIDTLAGNPYDFPFAIFRTVENNQARLVHSTSLGDAAKIIPQVVDLNGNYPLATVLRKAWNSREPQLFNNVSARVGKMPKGVWEINPDNVIVMPIMVNRSSDPYGLLVVGLNPYRVYDEKYSSFARLVSDQISTSFSNVLALEEERKRAQALAEIDLAKTTFFSNISHEFRTPLTLLLGPMEEILSDPSIDENNRNKIEVANRNALRLQRLVNTLLEFSRIEAGRVEGKFSRVDICHFTQELVSSFQSAMDKAGLQLQFKCGRIKSEVYVDLEMWEKIVLNLISNAFKYTHQGSISVEVKERKGEIVFSVSDTGIGIQKEYLDKIFERFQRISNVNGRSQEGTGIGLSLVKELVKINYGSISVVSQPGKGSTFTVTIPVGRDHLPKDKIVGGADDFSLSKNSIAFVEEAMKWLPGEDTQEEIAHDVTREVLNKDKSEKKFRVLLADDNADMRDYIRRLLGAEFEVVVAVDGEDAFKKLLKYEPDLVLSDIMMPRLDGFGFLEKIRSHPDKKNIPVIFLSARSGEEAKVEGLDAGADDYLTKPFSAKELIARIEANIKIARNRAASENHLRLVIRQSPVATTLLRGPSFQIEIVNDKGLEVWGRNYEEVINKPLAEALPEVVEQGFINLLKEVYETGKTYEGNEVPVELVRYGQLQTIYLNFIYEPLKDENGQVFGILGVGIDITEQVKSRERVEQGRKELNELANAVPHLVWVCNPEGGIIYYNERISEYLDVSDKKTDSHWWKVMLHEDDFAITREAWDTALKTGYSYHVEHRMKMADGTYRWHLSRAIPHRDENGHVLKWFGSSTDIHISKEQAHLLEDEVKRRTAELQHLNLTLLQSNNELQQFAHVASHDLKEPLRKIKTFIGRLSDDEASVFSDKSKTYLQKVNSASDRMFSMIEGVLNYSVLNTSDQKIEPVSLRAIIENIESDLELPIMQKKASIRCEDLPVLEGSSILLYQLFYNLINNSLKFTREGVKPVIRISSAIAGEPGEQSARIIVEDNGIGFEQQYAERIFESFARLNSKDQYEGTGLGLSLCKRIVERHGGSIIAKGKINEGASFVIYLPMEQKTKII